MEYVQKLMSEVIFTEDVNINEIRLMQYFLNNMKRGRLVATRDALIGEAKVSGSRIVSAIKGCESRGWIIECVIGVNGNQKRYLLLNTAYNRRLAERAERFYSRQPVKAIENKVTPISEASGQRVKIPKRLRIEVLNRDKSTCVMCGRKAPDVALHVDHIVPVSQGGATILENLQTLCEDCNIGKSNVVELHVNAN